MSEKPLPSTSQGAPDLRAVERALAELRRGSPVILRGGEVFAVVLAAETLTESLLAWARGLSSNQPALVLTSRRAAAVGLIPPSETLAQRSLALPLLDRDAKRILALADPSSQGTRPLARPVPEPTRCEIHDTAIELAKLARLLPAAVVLRLSRGEALAKLLSRQDLIAVRQEQVEDYRESAARRLTRVAEARVPLAGAESSRLVAYRPSDGGLEHLAILIGEPDAAAAVLTRIHSECFTGDLLGSLRCDCGDQLRGAISTIAEAGSGILLYLAQEGRGIGLVNKLRAYALQDAGADTLDANEQLGFDADERIYLPAAAMLKDLGYHRVRLLTNNPDKVNALVRQGIRVEERVAHRFPSNAHNEAYLDAKTRRFGHLS